MARFVIDADTALAIVRDSIAIPAHHSLLASTLLRSQVLNRLFSSVCNGTLGEPEGLAINSRFAKLKVRYLGDAVLRRRAWIIARELGWASTFDAEAIALTQLQGDALMTDNPELKDAARSLVEVVSLAALR